MAVPPVSTTISHSPRSRRDRTRREDRHLKFYELRDNLRVVRHPRQETTRLKQIAADGEQGSSPFIEIPLVARLIVPLVLIMVGIALLVYLKA
jgi:hypothetical protein